MRVAIVSQYYPPERGAVRYGHRLATGLAARGRAVTVIAEIPHYPTGIPNEEFVRWKPSVRIEGGVCVIRMPLVMGANTQPVRRMFGFATFALGVFPVLLLIARPDVIIASVPPATSSIPALLASWLRRCPLVVLLRDVEPVRALAQRDKADGVVGRALIAFFMWIYRRADRVVVVHPREAGMLLHCGIDSDQIAVIPHAIDESPQISPAVKGATITFPRTSGRLVALYVGTIGLAHGLETLLTAIADEAIRDLPVDFVFIGDGQYLRPCIEIVRARRLSNVSFLPPMPLDQVDSALKQADMLVCSYRDQDDVPLGSKFYEYCAAGKPILVHGRNHATTMVCEIGNGLACSAGDINGLRAALLDFTGRPEYWKSQGECGREYALSHFSQHDRNLEWDRLLAGLTEQVSTRPVVGASADEAHGDA